MTDINQGDLFGGQVVEKEEKEEPLPPGDRKLKRYLNSLVDKYKTPDFIPKDPVKFVHRFEDDNDREVIGLLSSTMAQGRRTTILASMEKICDYMEDKPFEFVSNFDPVKDTKLFAEFSHFAYRTIGGGDIACLIFMMKQVLEKYGSLKRLFLKGFRTEHETIKEALSKFVETMYDFKPLPGLNEIPGRVKSLIPSPNKGSACKRLNMYLRWMVREDNVDFGLWKEISTSKLIIPLDVHVARLSRELGLITRKSNDWKAAEGITAKLREFDRNDPVKYDFAIFGMGVAGEKPF